MRKIAIILIGLTVSSVSLGQPPENRVAFERFKVPLNLTRYPQLKPQEAMKSVADALSIGDYHYLMAHLADPTFVDSKINEYKKRFTRGPEEAKALVAFQQLVVEIEKHFRDDPSLFKELQEIGKTGQWQEGEELAVGRTPEVASRKAFFKKIDGRWFLLNKQQ